MHLGLGVDRGLGAADFLGRLDRRREPFEIAVARREGPVGEFQTHQAAATAWVAKARPARPVRTP